MTASPTTTAKKTSRKRNRFLPPDLLNAFHQSVETTLLQHSFDSADETSSSAAIRSGAAETSSSAAIRSDAAAGGGAPASSRHRKEPPRWRRSGAPSDRPLVDDSFLQTALRTSITACLTCCAYLMWTNRFAHSPAIAPRQFFDDLHGAGSYSMLDIEGICGRLRNAGVSQMQTEDLARLYQYILSFRVVKHDTVSGAWSLQPDEKAKKDLGNFYTPMELSRLAAKQALEPLVRGADGHLQSPGQILDLQIVDPAMGGGAFLCAALDYLTAVLEESIAINKQQATYLDPRQMVLTNCLHGVDLDPVAVEVCLLTLVLESQCPEKLPEISASLRRQLKCGNSLIGCWQPQANTKFEADLYCAAWFRDNAVDPTRRSRRGDAMRRPEQAGAMLRTMHGTTPTTAGLNGDRTLPANAVDQITEDVLEETQRLSRRLRFFHWELEFPHVFARQNPGFDAVVGNPPWEIHKPNSREFFQRLDPSYWHYGKQHALSRQEELFRTNPIVHQMWLEYQSDYLAFRRWVRDCGRAQIAAQTVGSAGSNRPFRYQGSADLNAYKLFLEAGHHLLRNNGVLSFIVPSGIYSDLGARALRRLFLEQSRWLSLIGFENRAGIFDIHRSFKFCLIAVQKGGETDALSAQFMLTDPAQVKDGFVPPGVKRETSASAVTGYSRSLIETFSPGAFSIFEFEHHRDLQVLEKIYSGSTRLCDGFAQIEFEREFDMTNDSKLFLPVQSLVSQGFVHDEYGHWLAGKWSLASTSCRQSTDVIFSADRLRQIAIEDVVDVALPLYEGRMVGQFDFSQKGWVSGKSRRAVWTAVTNEGKNIHPQYVVLAENYSRWAETAPLKCGFLAVGSATNARSMIASAIDNLPCGNSVGTLKLPTSQQALLLLACLNSYVFDFALRCRLAGNNLNYFVIAECPLPRLDLQSSLARLLAHAVARLNLNHPIFARRWIELLSPDGLGSNETIGLSVSSESDELDRWWLRDHHERRRVRALVDASLAHIYGLTLDDLDWILRGCTESSAANRSAKGFWRGEKELLAQQRQSTLTLKAYEIIAELGIDHAFEQAAVASLNAPIQARLQQHAMRKHHLLSHCSG